MVTFFYKIILFFLLIIFIIIISLSIYKLLTYSCEGFTNKFLKKHMMEHIESHKIKYNSIKGNKNAKSLINKIQLYSNKN